MGLVVHSNDKYFYRSDGYSKSRESVVIGKNKYNEVALAKLTTSKNEKYKDVPNYNGSRFMTEDVYTSDNTNKRIVISKSKKLSDNNKFIKSHFDDVPVDSVEYIKNELVNNDRFGKRNQKRLEQLKKPRR